MAVTRKALAYSKRKVTAYTRKSKKKSKNYVKTVPQQKIVKFNMGNVRAFNKGEFKHAIRIITKEAVQIRDLALEAVRQRLQGNLQRKILLPNYYLAVRAYPHQILRDNKTFSGGTKGERIQTGMKHSFGSTAGRSAPVKKGKAVYEVFFLNKKDLKFIRDLCKSATPKLPCKCKVVYEELK
jgi:large subunit ribosomal protein L10e